MSRPKRPHPTPLYDWVMQRCIVTDSGCREWPGSVNSKGYGTVGTPDGDTTSPHRVVAEHHLGPAPIDRPFVLHSCDNTRCCEITHLRYGTQTENLAEMTARGRRVTPSRVGEFNASAKLTEADVLAIRADDRMHRVIAAEYGVVRSTISRVKAGRGWGHIVGAPAQFVGAA